MKFFFFLLLSLPLLSFEGKTLYECVSMYRIIDGSPHEFSPEEQEKSKFQLIFDTPMHHIKTSNGIIYTISKNSLKGALYVNKSVVNGRTLFYKLKIANAKGLYKSVSVTGYGDLINEYTLCEEVKNEALQKGE